jgi:hypothetical protein
MLVEEAVGLMAVELLVQVDLVVEQAVEVLLELQEHQIPAAEEAELGRRSRVQVLPAVTVVLVSLFSNINHCLLVNSHLLSKVLVFGNAQQECQK